MAVRHAQPLQVACRLREVQPPIPSNQIESINNPQNNLISVGYNNSQFCDYILPDTEEFQEDFIHLGDLNLDKESSTITENHFTPISNESIGKKNNIYQEAWMELENLESTIINEVKESKIVLHKSDKYNTLKILSSKTIRVMSQKIKKKKIHMLTENTKNIPKELVYLADKGTNFIPNSYENVTKTITDVEESLKVIFSKTYIFRQNRALAEFLGNDMESSIQFSK